MHAIDRSCNIFKRLCRNVARLSELLANIALSERFQLGERSFNRHENTSKLERTDLEHVASLEKDLFKGDTCGEEDVPPIPRPPNRGRGIRLSCDWSLDGAIVQTTVTTGLRCGLEISDCSDFT